MLFRDWERLNVINGFSGRYVLIIGFPVSKDQVLFKISLICVCCLENCVRNLTFNLIANKSRALSSTH